ncbi:PREDICTED: venom serine protease 34-like isoform X2 [Wasmannia auropunctata]|uniref:venom serine protease 34-like isoform X2 n=1 Tax=Wasmannia auropunctata TaxID=64793 RepID=UPI0005EF2ACC|nr:PREDICTED: venom serine protease 34-like isoform X2 [Wasmannia auropunctata]
MLHVQYFVLINLVCLVVRHVNTLSWYEREHGHTDIFHRRSEHEHCECGKKIISPSSRIIGGREVFENEYPWMAGIISINRSQVICGASIINDRYVITAAHCIIYGKDDLKVSVGAHNSCKWDSKSIIFSVKSIFPHPNYNRETNFADIMLVKLIMRISFNKFVKPICLPKLELDAVSQYGGQSVSALGWGFSERSKESPRGTCGGDSGGPLQILDENYKHVLIGITSSGVLCANVNYPDFYTDVTQMVSWILQVTKHDSKYCWH